MSTRFIARSVSRLRRLGRWLATEDYLYGKVLGSSLAGSGAIVLLAVVFLAVTSRERDFERVREATHKVLRVTDKVENNLVTIESAQRDFLLTGDRVFLEQFDHHHSALNARLAELEGLAAHVAGHSDRLRRIREHLAAWENGVALPQIAAREEGLDPSPLISRSRGKAMLTTVRAGLADFARVTGDILDQVESEAELQRMYHVGGGAVLCILAIVFLLASSGYSFAAYRRHLHKIETAQAQTRAIIASALDAVVTVNSDGLIASINPAGEKMFGRVASDVIGSAITNLIPGGIFYNPASQTGNATHLTAGSRRDATPFPIEFSLSEMVVDHQKQFVAIIRDITDRKRTEETLKQIGLGVSADTGEEFIKSLVQQLSRTLQSDFAFVVELTGRDDQSSVLTLSEKGALHSTGSFALSHTACAEVLKNGFRAYLRNARTHHPDDALLAGLEIETFVAMPLADHSGRSVGVMGVLDREPLENAQVIESTLQIFAARAAAELERMRYEDEIAAEKDRLAVTLRSIGEGFVTIDQSGQVLMLNSVAERLLGWTQERALGRRVTEVFQLLDQHTRCSRTGALDRLVVSGNARELSGPMLLQSHDGGERLVEITATSISDKAKRTGGAVLVFRDVTERAHAEEERRKAEKLESLGLAAGGIAHDFNNLLTSILGNVSLALYGTGLGRELIDRLTSAKKATLRAQELAQQLLTFAKGGAPIKQSASISQLLRDTVTFSLRGSAVRGEFDIPADLWAAEVDAGQISQVVSNLTINADQAMPAGGTLRVAGANFTLSADNPRLGLKAGRYVKITMQDQGIGIAEEHLKKIFDPYFSTKPKGSGLGLATAYSIIKSHEGVIDVVSHPGEGTTFYVFLPATDKPIPAEAEALDPVSAPYYARILVLDDEEAICTLVSCALGPLGYEVVQTHDALSAIQAYENALHNGRRFDLVISDLTIPGGMGGKEAVRRLHAIDPEVRAIVSSGYHNDPVMSSYREHGFCAMIAKPYELDALGRIVAEVLSKPAGDKVIPHKFDKLKTA